ncbi:MAG: ATP-binding protein [Actinobacteria bacterium]|nr:ATP-binding protein [Actinomycetota bacterium]
MVDLSVTTFLPAPSAPRRARDVVAAALRDAGLRNTERDAVLLVSELVTNAIRHADSDVMIAVDQTEDRVRFSVTDFGPGWPVRQPPDGQGGGYGLQFVDAVATNWGAYRIGDGKTVWFELPAS